MAIKTNSVQGIFSSNTTSDTLTPAADGLLVVDLFCTLGSMDVALQGTTPLLLSVPLWKGMTNAAGTTLSASMDSSSTPHRRFEIPVRGGQPLRLESTNNSSGSVSFAMQVILPPN